MLNVHTGIGHQFYHRKKKHSDATEEIEEK